MADATHDHINAQTTQHSIIAFATIQGVFTCATLKVVVDIVASDLIISGPTNGIFNHRTNGNRQVLQKAADI